MADDLMAAWKYMRVPDWICIWNYRCIRVSDWLVRIVEYIGLYNRDRLHSGSDIRAHMSTCWRVPEVSINW